jgi:hypothetical protein
MTKRGERLRHWEFVILSSFVLSSLRIKNSYLALAFMRRASCDFFRAAVLG